MSRRTEHYFIFYFMLGGWDLALNTDPVPGNGDKIWIPYDADDVVEVGAHKFGPAFKPLLPYVEQMGVVRGIYCDALNHPQARIRMCTGRFRSGNTARPGIPSVQAILGEKIGMKYEIPNISGDALRPSTFRGDEQDPRLEPMRVSSIDQLKGLVSWKGDVAKYRRDVEEAMRKLDADFLERNKDNALANEFNTYANLARDTLDSDFPKRARAMSNSVTDVERTQKAARMAVEAIAQDLAPVVTIGSGEFDSHTKSQYSSHFASVKRGMSAVATVCDGLSSYTMPGGKTLLDHTTVVVTSEFSRDPMKNELGGKHHWPTNSMLIIGKGVKKSKGAPTVFGETDAGLNHVEINPSNGSLKRGVEAIEMTHALATVIAMAGIDPAPYFGAYDPIVPLIG
jgi:hypothetical protein